MALYVRQLRLAEWDTNLKIPSTVYKNTFVIGLFFFTFYAHD